MLAQAVEQSINAIAAICVTNFFFVFMCRPSLIKPLNIRKPVAVAGAAVHGLGLDYFMRMSFLTDFTPLTPRATFVAVAMLSTERTKPLS
jgi:hypothetical protein